jgi:hypothetical protein
MVTAIKIYPLAFPPHPFEFFRGFFLFCRLLDIHELAAHLILLRLVHAAGHAAQLRLDLCAFFQFTFACGVADGFVKEAGRKN